MNHLHITISTNLTIPDCPEHLARELSTSLAIPNPKFSEALKAGRYTGNIPRVLEFCRRDLKGTLHIPRGYGLHFDRLARQCGLIPEYEDHRRELEPLNIEFKGTLRDYQQEAVSAVLARYFGVLTAGTGAGKTIMALGIIAARKQPTLILAHTKELLTQWRDRIRSFLGIEAGTVGGGRFDVQPITVGTVQTVRKHLAELVPHFGHLIVDECHRTPSTTFSETVEAFDCKYMLGLSATPYRRDGLSQLIHLALGDRVHQVDENRLREIGAILRPEVILRRTGFSYSGDAAGEYSTMLGELVADFDRNRFIAGDVLQEVDRSAGTCLVVSDRVEHLEALADIIERQGQPVTLLTGRTPAKDREKIVDGLKSGEIRILGSTAQLIGEGFDAPGLASLFLATPISFSGKLIQVVGRVLRPQPGKVPRIFDYVDSRVGVLDHSARKRQATYQRM